MKSLLRAGLGLSVIASLFAFTACGDDDSASDANGGSGGTSSLAGGPQMPPQGGAAEVALECAVIGELCHDADTGSGPAHDCHEYGHEGNGPACAKEFGICIGACVPQDDASGGADAAPDSRCVALGELCHPVDDTNGPLHQCHLAGHEGNAANCALVFDDCAAACLAARARVDTGAGGAGGAVNGAGGLETSGGMPSAGGGAPSGGASLGGAGGAR